MKPPGQHEWSIKRKRRYVVHLFCRRDLSDNPSEYVSHIQPWVSRMGSAIPACERVFSDECSFIETVNSVLPPGSDVRDVFSHIESPEGFFYLLQLQDEEAHSLGWIDA